MLFCDAMKRGLEKISLEIGGDDDMLDELWILNLDGD